MRKTQRAWRRAALTVAASILASAAANGATIPWTNSGGGSFGVPGNWNSGAGPVPTTPDTAQFNIGNTYNVALNISPTNTAVSVGGSNVTLTNSAAGRTYTVSGALTTTSGSLTLNAAQPIAFTAGSATLNANTDIDAGSDLNVGALAIGSTTTATTTIDGSGSTLTATGTTSIGNAGGGNGSLILQNGALGTFGLMLLSTSPSAGDAGMTVQSGADVNVSSSVSIALGGTAGQSGSLTIDGTGSTMTHSAGNLNIGTTANSSGTLIVSNSGAYSLSGTVNVGSTGLILLTTGGTIGSGSLNIATTSGTGSGGTVTIGGSGASFTQGGASTLTIGNATSGSGTLVLNGSGIFTTGTGLTTVNSTGLIDINTSGTFNANGDITLAGGTLDRASNGTLNWAGGKTMTVSAGGGLQIGGTYQLPGSAIVNVSGAGAEVNCSFLLVQSGSQLNASSGGFLNLNQLVVGGASSGNVTVGSGGNLAAADVTVGTGGVLDLTGTGALELLGDMQVGGGTVNVSSSVGFFWNAPGGAMTISAGQFNQTGVFSAPDDAVISIYGLGAQLNITGSSSKLDLPQGGQLTVSNRGALTTGGLVMSQATAVIEGQGTTLTSTGTNASPFPSSLLVSTLTVRDNATATFAGILNVSNGALHVESGATLGANTVTMSSSGSIVLDNATFNLGASIPAPVGPPTTVGAFTFVSGTLNVLGDVTIANNEFLQGLSTLPASRNLSVGGTLNIGTGFGLSLAGGTLTVGALNPSGSFSFTSGTLGITGAGGLTVGSSGPLGSAVAIGAGQTLNVSNTTTINAAAGVILNTGGTFGGTGGISSSGAITMAGGLIAGTGTITSNNLLSGYGTIIKNLTNAGTVTAKSGSLLIGGVGTTVTNTGLLQNNPGANLFVQSSFLTNGGNVTVNAGGSVIFDASLSFTSSKTLAMRGGILGTPTLTNFAGGTVNGYGQLTGNLTNSGSVDFYNSMTIEGNLTNNVGGTMLVRNAQTLITGSSTNNGTITIGSGGTIVFMGGLIGNPPSSSVIDPGGEMLSNFVRQQSVTIGGTLGSPGLVTIRKSTEGADTSVVNTLSIAGGATPLGRWNLQDNKLIAHSTPAGTWNGSAYTDMTALIASGRNGNTAPLWDGNGIVTAQTTAIATDYHSIGVARASDIRPNTASVTETWAGQTITGNDTLVMYTYGGDATLDGKLNILDYVRIDQGLAAGLTGWSNGDFNYDGKINILDYAPIIDSNIGTQGPAFPTTGGLQSVAAVPEPAALAAFVAIPLLARRRPRQGCVIVPST